MLKRPIVVVYIMMFLAMLFGFGANAERGSITVNYTANNHSEPISGAEFGIVQLLVYQNGTYFLTAKGRLAGITEADILDAPQSTAEKLCKKMKPEHTLTTDAGGSVCFENLSDGVYLIWMTAKEKEAKDYEDASPALVSIPKWKGKKPDYEQIIYPKTVRRTAQEPATEEKNSSVSPVQTGDHSRMAFWIFLFGFSGNIILIRFLKKKQERETAV